VRAVSETAERRRGSRELPPPLPPQTRTVGQLVAEAIRFYGSRFWPSLALGIPPALLVVAGAPLPNRQRILLVLVAAPLLLTVSYVRACVLVLPERRGSLAVAFAAGVLVFAPVPLLLATSVLLTLAALGWLALFGLVVPVVLAQGLAFRTAFRRAAEIARADYVHALGGLSTLAIVAFLSQAVLFFLLRGAGEAAVAVAAFLANLVVSPVLFLGAALLYLDQAARSEARPSRRARVRSSKAR
jgi:hypothetical protein